MNFIILRYSHGSADPGVVVFFIFLVAIIIIAGAFFSRKAIVARRLRKTQMKRIRDVQDGEVIRLTGNVKLLGETLRAPLSGRKCAYFHVHVERHQHNGKHSHWHTIINDEQMGDLVIHDSTGYAMVTTEFIKSYVMKDREYESGFLKDANPELRAYLAQFNYDSETFLGFNKHIRYKEGVLEADETITIAGRARWAKKSEVKLNIPAERILLIEAEESNEIYLTDDPEIVSEPGNIEN